MIPPKYIFCLFKAILYMEGDFSGGGTEMLKKVKCHKSTARWLL